MFNIETSSFTIVLFFISFIHCSSYKNDQFFQYLQTCILTAAAAAASANTLDLDFLVVKDSPETSISKSGGKIIVKYVYRNAVLFCFENHKRIHMVRDLFFYLDSYCKFTIFESMCLRVLKK